MSISKATEDRNRVVYVKKVQFSCRKKVQGKIGGKDEEHGWDRITEGCVAM